MMRLLFLLVCASVLSAEWEGIPIEWGGMTIYCREGCGDDDDPDIEKIQVIFANRVKKVFHCRDTWDDKLCRYGIDPWKNLGDSVYEPWDWEASNSFWPGDGPIPRKFLVLSTYSEFQEIATVMRKDLYFYYVEWPQFAIQKYHSVISKLREVDRSKYYDARPYDGGKSFDLHKYAWYEYRDDGTPQLSPYQSSRTTIEDRISGFEEDIRFLEREYGKEENKYVEYSAYVEEGLRKIEARYKGMFVFCLENHQLEGAIFHAAIENLIIGEYVKGIGQIQWLIDFSEEKNLGNDLLSKLYLLKGELQSEFCQYSDAIIGLTTAIQKNPSQKEAYLERAFVYFELGEFDKSIEDYLSYDPSQMDLEFKLTWTQIPPMSAGIAAGILKGGFGEARDFLPEMLSTARGLGLGLWASVRDPVGASIACVTAARECIQYIKNHTFFEFAQNMVPELKELIQKYDELSDFQKGEQIGLIMGKYGVDVLFCNYSAKAVKAYKDLKRANQLMTLEMLNLPKYRQEIAEVSKKAWVERQNFLKKIKLEPDKQGKHVPGHKNYNESINRSIWEYPLEQTQALVDEYASYGIVVRGEIGNPGYQEIINFRRHVGYVIKPKTGEKIPTTWGKVHYSMDGVHVVPCLFRE